MCPLQRGVRLIRDLQQQTQQEVTSSRFRNSSDQSKRVNGETGYGLERPCEFKFRRDSFSCNRQLPL